MKKHFFGTALLFLLSHNVIATAPLAGLKIGYVNFDVAFSQEQEAQKYIKELENEERVIMEAEQKARTDIEAEMNKLQASMGKLDEKARQAQQATLGNKINALQQQFTQQRMGLEQKRQGIQADLRKKNQLLLGSIAKENGYGLILSALAVEWISEDLEKHHNVTPEVVDRYNKAYPVKQDVPKKAGQRKN